MVSDSEYVNDPEAGLKQDGIQNPEYYRRRGIAPPVGLTSESKFSTWRASMGNRLQRMMGGRLDDRI
jgi:hypothetical protein